MDKGAIPAVGWQITGGSVLQTLDDGGLAGPVVTDDESQWRIETDCLAVVWCKGSDALNGQSIDARHGVNDVTRVTTVCDEVGESKDVTNFPRYAIIEGSQAVSVIQREFKIEKLRNESQDCKDVTLSRARV